MAGGERPPKRRGPGRGAGFLIDAALYRRLLSGDGGRFRPLDVGQVDALTQADLALYFDAPDGDAPRSAGAAFARSVDRLREEGLTTAEIKARLAADRAARRPPKAKGKRGG